MKLPTDLLMKGNNYLNFEKREFRKHPKLTLFASEATGDKITGFPDKNFFRKNNDFSGF